MAGVHVSRSPPRLTAACPLHRIPSQHAQANKRTCTGEGQEGSSSALKPESAAFGEGSQAMDREQSAEPMDMDTDSEQGIWPSSHTSDDPGHTRATRPRLDASCTPSGVGLPPGGNKGETAGLAGQSEASGAPGALGAQIDTAQLQLLLQQAQQQWALPQAQHVQPEGRQSGVDAGSSEHGPSASAATDALATAASTVTLGDMGAAAALAALQSGWGPVLPAAQPQQQEQLQGQAMALPSQQQQQVLKEESTGEQQRGAQLLQAAAAILASGGCSDASPKLKPGSDQGSSTTQAQQGFIGFAGHSSHQLPLQLVSGTPAQGATSGMQLAPAAPASLPAGLPPGGIIQQLLRQSLADKGSAAAGAAGGSTGSAATAGPAGAGGAAAGAAAAAAAAAAGGLKPAGDANAAPAAPGPSALLMGLQLGGPSVHSQFSLSSVCSDSLANTINSLQSSALATSYTSLDSSLMEGAQLERLGCLALDGLGNTSAALLSSPVLKNPTLAAILAAAPGGIPQAVAGAGAGASASAAGAAAEDAKGQAQVDTMSEAVQEVLQANIRKSTSRLLGRLRTSGLGGMRSEGAAGGPGSNSFLQSSQSLASAPAAAPAAAAATTTAGPAAALQAAPPASLSLQPLVTQAPGPAAAAPQPNISIGAPPGMPLSGATVNVQMPVELLGSLLGLGVGMPVLASAPAPQPHMGPVLNLADHRGPPPMLQLSGAAGGAPGLNLGNPQPGQSAGPVLQLGGQGGLWTLQHLGGSGR